jgi:UDP-N-acetylglucosamine acyltransferase
MVEIHPTAIVESGAELADSVVIGPYCIVGSDVKLAEGVRLESHVVINGQTQVGKDTTIYPFASIGQPPQHMQYAGEKVKLVIGDNNIIREHVTMNPGTHFGHGQTKVGNNGFFMVGSHVAHDCVVGDDVIFANNATIGGHVTVGDFVMVGGLAAIHQHSRIGNHAFVGGMAAVANDVIPFGSVQGNHAHLAGLNIVGLKRRGFSRDLVHDLRSAYRLLFAWEGTFQERIDDVVNQYEANPEVMEIINFIKEDSTRSICMPLPESSI